MKFTGRSLRFGGLTAAYAVGLRIEVIRRLSAHESEKILFRHYVDVLQPPSAEAHLFFDRIRNLDEASSNDRDELENGCSAN